MVILGGLELVAAGYVLHELGKDEDKAKDGRRRRHRHGSHSSHHRRDSDSRPRPSRPSAQSLAPPVTGPARPNSAPPPQAFHSGGPSMYQNPRPQQQPPFQGPPNPQTWPQPPRPNTQPPFMNNSGAMYRPSDFPSNPHQQPPQPPQFQQPPPPYQQHGPSPSVPGQMQHRPTMHFDMKTGKWQSNMLPPDMPRSGSVPTPSSRVRSGSNNLMPVSRLRERRRAYSSGSYTSDSGSDSDSDLAYGNMPGQRRQRRRSSGREVSRERPRPPTEISARREGDWYASQAGKRAPQAWDGRTNSMPVDLQAGPAGARSRTATAPVELPHQTRYELA